MENKVICAVECVKVGFGESVCALCKWYDHCGDHEYDPCDSLCYSAVAERVADLSKRGYFIARESK